ncbi:MAG: Glu-tRNA(Gln) amidotransferase subunit GatE [Candidatus Woesearchaeota archaeon]
MVERDYRKLGLRCGLEIHQQLDTLKLFSYAPSIIRDDSPHYTVKRKLRAVTGETGKKDAAALFEESSDKSFIYQGYDDTVSNIEIDEEPPRLMNPDALEAALQVSLLLEASVVDELQVMRKIVVDGSNTSGFQRTSLVARNGSVKLEHGNIGVPTISIEEDSAKIISRDVNNSTITYNLSRLGIPLIEIGTDPDITSPEMAKEVAERLGMMLRSTGKVKRGLGTIRQDLNVSISGGSRIEIKGAQDLRMIPAWIDNEVDRQLKLIAIKDWLKTKKVSILKQKKDVSDVFQDTSSKMVSSALSRDEKVMALVLKNFNGVLGEEVNPGRRVGTELSDYAKAASGLKGIIHSDEDLSKYSFSDDEVKALRKKLSLDDHDLFVLAVGNKRRVEAALDAVMMRAKLLSSRVPKEVRRANPDGTTSFMRPMPGSSRMYPETDCTPVYTPEILSNIAVPELIEHKITRYVSGLGLSKDLAMGVAKFDYSRISFSGITSFDDLVKKFDGLDPSFIAQAILNYPKEVRKRHSIEFTDDNYKEVFTLLDNINAGEITKGAFMELLPRMIRKERIDYSDYRPIDKSQVKDKISSIVAANQKLSRGALMGMCMKEFRGKIDGKTISDILDEELSEDEK